MSQPLSQDGVMSMPAYPIPPRARSYGLLNSAAQESSTDSPGFSNLQQTQSLPHLLEPWMLDGPSCPSPLSTASSLGTLESISPPPVAGQLPLPMYYPELPMPLHTDGMGEGLSWTNSSSGWHGNNSECESWNLIPIAPEWMGNNVCNIYHQPINPYPGSMSTIPSLFAASPTDPYLSVPQDATLEHHEQNNTIGTDSPDSASGSDSESDSDDDSASDDDTSSPHSSSTTRRATTRASRTTSPILNLGRWSATQPSYTTSDARHYICRYSIRPDPDGKLCNKRFQRPEHLRRHEKTVHLNQRDYPCKVPRCGRAFSRGDNLRDHYWTHLNRGGRVGTNAKMALADLKEILGPREKKLVKRLRRKLKVQKEKVLLKSKL